MAPDFEGSERAPVFEGSERAPVFEGSERAPVFHKPLQHVRAKHVFDIQQYDSLNNWTT